MALRLLAHGAVSLMKGSAFAPKRMNFQARLICAALNSIPDAAKIDAGSLLATGRAVALRSFGYSLAGSLTRQRDFYAALLALR